MNLKGSFEKLQKSGAHHYLRLAQIFDSNHVIRDTWIALAQDMEQQAAGLEMLPPQVWKKLRGEAESLDTALKSCEPSHVIDSQGDKSLHRFFSQALDFEEPLILKAYVPIIRRLRNESSTQALEFYIRVKAHVARLLRLIQPFEGDPAILRRVSALQEMFEHEVQAPEIQPSRQKSQKAAGLPASARKHLPAKARKSGSASRLRRGKDRPLPLPDRPRVAKRVKSLVGKIEVRRRAQG